MEAIQDLRDLLDPPSEKQKIVLVTGTFQGGKTTFITSLTGAPPIKVHSGSYTRYSYPCELGSLKFGDGNRLLLLSWLGPAGLDGLKGIIAGYILVFNPSRPEMFREVRSIRESSLGSGVPLVIAGNKDADTGAWELSDLRVALHLSEQDVLVSCEAVHYRSVANTILTLTEQFSETDFFSQLKEKLR